VEFEIKARMIAGAKSQEFGEVDPADNKFEAYLPFYLQVQAQTYANIKAAGRMPRPDDFGGDHPLILARFMEHLDRVRAIDEKTLGSEHPSFATTLANLAGVYRETGRYAEAERLYDWVRAIEEKTPAGTLFLITYLIETRRHPLARCAAGHHAFWNVPRHRG
jgi:tetratricopeptide (TPR) repeat protein